MMPVFLSGGGSVTPSVVDNLFDSATKMVDLAMTTFMKICENPVLIMFVAIGVVSAVLTVLALVRRAAGMN